jgi:dihydroflavonol-4-reductase
VINPVGIFGPVLGGDLATSVAFVKQMMDGKMPVCPRIYFGVVDVRDVADLHLRAMESAAAKGQRFIAAAGDVVALIDVARVLRQRLGARAGKVPKVQLPDWLARLMARWNPALRNALPQLGVIRRVSNEKARRLLDWTPRSNEDAITATGESLAEL